MEEALNFIPSIRKVYYQNLTKEFSAPFYKRIDASANAEQKNCLKNLSKNDVSADNLAGENILEKLTHASGNNAAIGGLKVVTENAWFAARPSEVSLLATGLVLPKP